MLEKTNAIIDDFSKYKRFFHPKKHSKTERKRLKLYIASFNLKSRLEELIFLHNTIKTKTENTEENIKALEFYMGRLPNKYSNIARSLLYFFKENLDAFYDNFRHLMNYANLNPQNIDLFCGDTRLSILLGELLYDKKDLSTWDLTQCDPVIFLLSYFLFTRKQIRTDFKLYIGVIEYFDTQVIKDFLDLLIALKIDDSVFRDFVLEILNHYYDQLQNAFENTFHHSTDISDINIKGYKNTQPVNKDNIDEIRTQSNGYNGISENTVIFPEINDKNTQIPDHKGEALLDRRKKYNDFLYILLDLIEKTPEIFSDEAFIRGFVSKTVWSDEDILKKCLEYFLKPYFKVYARESFMRKINKTIVFDTNSNYLMSRIDDLNSSICKLVKFDEEIPNEIQNSIKKIREVMINNYQNYKKKGIDSDAPIFFLKYNHDVFSGNDSLEVREFKKEVVTKGQSRIEKRILLSSHWVIYLVKNLFKSTDTNFIISFLNKNPQYCDFFAFELCNRIQMDYNFTSKLRINNLDQKISNFSDLNKENGEECSKDSFNLPLENHRFLATFSNSLHHHAEFEQSEKATNISLDQKFSQNLQSVQSILHLIFTLLDCEIFIPIHFLLPIPLRNASLNTFYEQKLFERYPFQISDADESVRLMQQKFLISILHTIEAVLRGGGEIDERTSKQNYLKAICRIYSILEEFYRPKDLADIASNPFYLPKYVYSPCKCLNEHNTCIEEGLCNQSWRYIFQIFSNINFHLQGMHGYDNCLFSLSKISTVYKAIQIYLSLSLESDNIDKIKLYQACFYILNNIVKPPFIKNRIIQKILEFLKPTHEYHGTSEGDLSGTSNLKMRIPYIYKTHSSKETTTSRENLPLTIVPDILQDIIKFIEGIKNSSFSDPDELSAYLDQIQKNVIILCSQSKSNTFYNKNLPSLVSDNIGEFKMLSIDSNVCENKFIFDDKEINRYPYDDELLMVFQDANLQLNNTIDPLLCAANQILIDKIAQLIKTQRSIDSSLVLMCKLFLIFSSKIHRSLLTTIDLHKNYLLLEFIPPFQIKRIKYVLQEIFDSKGDFYFLLAYITSHYKKYIPVLHHIDPVFAKFLTKHLCKKNLLKGKFLSHNWKTEKESAFLDPASNLDFLNKNIDTEYPNSPEKISSSYDLKTQENDTEVFVDYCQNSKKPLIDASCEFTLKARYLPGAVFDEDIKLSMKKFNSTGVESDTDAHMQVNVSEKTHIFSNTISSHSQDSNIHVKSYTSPQTKSRNLKLYGQRDILHQTETFVEKTIQKIHLDSLFDDESLYILLEDLLNVNIQKDKITQYSYKNSHLTRFSCLFKAEKLPYSSTTTVKYSPSVLNVDENTLFELVCNEEENRNSNSILDSFKKNYHENADSKAEFQNCALKNHTKSQPMAYSREKSIPDVYTPYQNTQGLFEKIKNSKLVKKMLKDKQFRNTDEIRSLFTSLLIYQIEEYSTKNKSMMYLKNLLKYTNRVGSPQILDYMINITSNLFKTKSNKQYLDILGYLVRGIKFSLLEISDKSYKEIKKTSEKSVIAFLKNISLDQVIFKADFFSNKHCFDRILFKALYSHFKKLSHQSILRYVLLFIQSKKSQVTLVKLSSRFLKRSHVALLVFSVLILTNNDFLLKEISNFMLKSLSLSKKNGIKKHLNLRSTNESAFDLDSDRSINTNSQTHSQNSIDMNFFQTDFQKSQEFKKGPGAVHKKHFESKEKNKNNLKTSLPNFIDPQPSQSVKKLKVFKHQPESTHDNTDSFNSTKTAKNILQTNFDKIMKFVFDILQKIILNDSDSALPTDLFLSIEDNALRFLNESNQNNRNDADLKNRDIHSNSESNTFLKFFESLGINKTMIIDFEHKTINEILLYLLFQRFKLDSVGLNMLKIVEVSGENLERLGELFYIDPKKYLKILPKMLKNGLSIDQNMTLELVKLLGTSENTKNLSMISQFIQMGDCDDKQRLCLEIISVASHSNRISLPYILKTLEFYYYDDFLVFSKLCEIIANEENLKSLELLISFLKNRPRRFYKNVEKWKLNPKLHVLMRRIYPLYMVDEDFYLRIWKSNSISEKNMLKKIYGDVLICYT